MTERTCGCKVNLGLAITGKRADGYHELDSFFYPLQTPFDTVTIEETGLPGIRLETDSPAVDPERNTITRAYRCLSQRVPLPNFRVRLEKGIPAGAGLGGGSSDAAAFLRLIQEFCPVSEEDLLEAAAQTGADVPFFLKNAPSRVGGIGEVLTRATISCAPCLILLVFPGYGIPTGQAYARYDAAGKKIHRALTRPSFAHTLTLSLEEETSQSVRSVIPWSLDNDLEDAVMPFYPELLALKNELFTDETLAVGMSGSGASLYALYSRNDETACRATEARMKKRGLACWVDTLH